MKLKELHEFAHELNDLLNKHKIQIVGTYDQGFMLFLKPLKYGADYSIQHHPTDEKAPVNQRDEWVISYPWPG